MNIGHEIYGSYQQIGKSMQLKKKFDKSRNSDYEPSLKTGKNIIFQPAHVSGGVHGKDLDIDI